MDKHKYYTPSPEEIYVGFECEMRPRIRGGIISYARNEFTYVDWWKHKIVSKEPENLYQQIEEFEDPFFLSDYLQYLKDEAIRVKYLDREDIESLGWKHLYEDTFKMSIKKFRGREDNDIHLVIMFERILICLGDDETMYSDYLTLFSGIIKNKSELKKIMQQLELL